MNFPSPLLKGVLIKHYRRNLADVRLESGEVVTAHTFFTGAMKGCDVPGSEVFLSDSGDRSRRHPLTWELVGVDGLLTGVNPKIAKHALLEAIINDGIDVLRGYRLNDGVVPGGGGSNDILLQSMKDNCLLNYQSVLWVEGGIGFIAGESAVSGFNHLERLTSFARSGHRAIAFFHVLRGDCTELRTADTMSKEQRKQIKEAVRAGVEFLAFQAVVTASGVEAGSRIPFNHS
jgi:sugar fermentation stimulation protein A